MKSTQQRFANCAKTRRGEHILFRSFGLDVTDRRGTLTRSDVMDQIDMYFPNIRRVNITKNGDEFDINLVGVAE